jgi:hypothetical protein
MSNNKWSSAADSIQDDFNNRPSWKDVDQEPEDYDNSGWLDRKTKKIQNDSLETSSRILSKVEHAQNVAQTSLSQLHAQSEKLNNIERKLDDTHHQVKISEVKTDRLTSLNRFFMIPAFGNKSRQRKEEALAKEVEDKKERDMQAKLRDQDLQERVKNRHLPGVHATRTASMAGNSQFYSTPAGLDRDETEVGIDRNLNQISGGLNRLRLMGQSMNDELDRHKDQLNRIQDRTDENRERVERLGSKMDAIANRKKR